MALSLFTIEGGLQIVGENEVTGPALLKGSGVPGNDTGPQDDASIGSIYLNTGAGGGLYKKIIDNNVAADWEEVGNVSLDEITWRNERVIAATIDTITAGAAINPNLWSDNESDIAGDEMTVGDIVIGDCDGTPALFQVDVITSDVSVDLSAYTPAIADGNTFVVQNYLPDSPAAQEKQAILHFPLAASACIKIADFNWSLADGINLTGGYVGTTNGTVAAGDTLEAAVGKMDANQKDLTTLTGEAQGAVDHGTFTGTIIPDNSTTHASLQALETEIELQVTDKKVTGITTLQDLDTVLVDSFHEIEWELVSWEEATPANKKYIKISALHNGTAAADATATDHDVFSKKKVGSDFNIVYSIDLNGATTAQTMRLRATSSSAGVTVELRRNGVQVQ